MANFEAFHWSFSSSKNNEILSCGLSIRILSYYLLTFIINDILCDNISFCLIVAKCVIVNPFSVIREAITWRLIPCTIIPTTSTSTTAKFLIQMSIVWTSSTNIRGSRNKLTWVWIWNKKQNVNMSICNNWTLEAL